MPVVSKGIQSCDYDYDASRFLFGFFFILFIDVMKLFDFSIMDLPKSAAPLWLFKMLLTLLNVFIFGQKVMSCFLRMVQ